MTLFFVSDHLMLALRDSLAGSAQANSVIFFLTVYESNRGESRFSRIHSLCNATLYRSNVALQRKQLHLKAGELSKHLLIPNLGLYLLIVWIHYFCYSISRTSDDRGFSKVR